MQPLEKKKGTEYLKNAENRKNAAESQKHATKKNAAANSGNVTN